MAHDVKFAQEIETRIEKTIMPKVKALINAALTGNVPIPAPTTANANVVNNQQANQNDSDRIKAELADLKRQIDGLFQIVHSNAGSFAKFETYSKGINKQLTELSDKVALLEGKPVIDYKLLDSTIRDIQSQLSTMQSSLNIQSKKDTTPIDLTPINNEINDLKNKIAALPPSFDATNLNNQIAALGTRITNVENQIQVIYNFLTGNKQNGGNAPVLSPSPSLPTAPSPTTLGSQILGNHN